MNKNNLLLVIAGLIEEKAKQESHFEQTVLERAAFFVESDNAASVQSMVDCLDKMMTPKQLKVLEVWMQENGFYSLSAWRVNCNSIFWELDTMRPEDLEGFESKYIGASEIDYD